MVMEKGRSREEAISTSENISKLPSCYGLSLPVLRGREDRGNRTGN